MTEQDLRTKLLLAGFACTTTPNVPNVPYDAYQLLVPHTIHLKICLHALSPPTISIVWMGDPSRIPLGKRQALRELGVTAGMQVICKGVRKDHPFETCWKAAELCLNMQEGALS